MAQKRVQVPQIVVDDGKRLGVLRNESAVLPNHNKGETESVQGLVQAAERLACRLNALSHARSVPSLGCRESGA